jgi:hypothetical protein
MLKIDIPEKSYDFIKHQASSIKHPASSITHHASFLEHTMYTRKFALSQAKIYRTCPPPNIADHPAYQEYLQQHFSICPYCSAQVTDDRRNWGILAKQIQDRLPSPPISDDILKGQLRYIRSSLSRWHDGYFYNPPLVMVLEESNGSSERISVAQTYHDICLAAPGDLILSDGQTDGIFAECWNIYTLPPGDLGISVGQTAPELTDIIKELNSNFEAYPSWALQPKPLAENDPRIFFRELEREVALIFSATT